MKISLGTNWDPELVNALAKYDQIEDVYAKLAVDVVGGGRPSYVIPDVDRQQVVSHIEACHTNGIQFTYLLNASCLHGREFDREWRTAFSKLLDELVEMGVDRVTVAIPYLIEIIKARHPNLLINVSSFAQINSVEGAQRFARIGVDEITLDFMSIQRDFKLMAAMVKAVDVQFQVLANHTCLYQCPSRSYHANLSSHASQCSACGNGNDGAILDYCVLECLHTKLNDPTEMIKSQWIRPEDLWHYEEIGIQKIKLVDRARSTDWILKVVDAYINRCTPSDNLMDILNAVGSGSLPYADFGVFLQADAATMEMAQTMGTLASHQFLCIDNRELDGFLDRIKQIDCRSMDCNACGYCAEVASRAVKNNADLPSELAATFPSIKQGLQIYLEDLYDGCVFDKSSVMQ